MKCFRLEVVEEGHLLQEDGEFNEARSTFLIHRGVWQGILHLASTAGILSNLNSRIEVECGICGSFMLPAGHFLEFVQQMEQQIENGDEYLVQENLWHIFQSLVETKFNNEDAFWNNWRDGDENHRLLKDKNGEPIFDEITGWPLSLSYDDVSVKTASPYCSSCNSLFRLD